MDYKGLQNKKNNLLKGFTIIELIIVIAIIAVLASVVLSNVSKYSTKAGIARTTVEARDIIKAMLIARGNSGQTLKQITGSQCSNCCCRTSLSLKGDTGCCYTTWSTVLNAISNASNGFFVNSSSFTRDPWGSPYLLDENEGESGGCLQDDLKSAGPDGILSTSDDISFVVPLSGYSGCPLK